jgi:hypothetical protein
VQRPRGHGRPGQTDARLAAARAAHRRCGARARGSTEDPRPARAARSRPIPRGRRARATLRCPKAAVAHPVPLFPHPLEEQSESRPAATATAPAGALRALCPSAWRKSPGPSLGDPGRRPAARSQQRLRLLAAPPRKPRPPQLLRPEAPPTAAQIPGPRPSHVHPPVRTRRRACPAHAAHVPHAPRVPRPVGPAPWPMGDAAGPRRPRPAPPRASPRPAPPRLSVARSAAARAFVCVLRPGLAAVRRTPRRQAALWRHVAERGSGAAGREPAG